MVSTVFIVSLSWDVIEIAGSNYAIIIQIIGQVKVDWNCNADI